MILINNCTVDLSQFNFDLFICTVNYEERSFSILNKFKHHLSYENTLILTTDNIETFPKAYQEFQEYKNTLHVEILSYHNSEEAFCSLLKNTINRIKEKTEAIRICIDYSSMPRKWYCSLPALLKSIMSDNDIAYFWYTEGIYAGQQEQYPTAGTNAYTFFSGKPSLYATARTHILGLSYDAIRTSSIIQKTDPDYLLLLKACDLERKDILQRINSLNSHIIQRAAYSTTLDISDFSFMISRIREIVYERIQTDDVILIPDGPKPLILAMSMITLFINRVGITCIHVARNMPNFFPVEVKASNKIVGFSFRVQSDK